MIKKFILFMLLLPFVEILSLGVAHLDQVESLSNQLAGACQRGDEKKARELLNLGAKIDYDPGGWGETPLFLACRNDHSKVVSLLLESKASPEIVYGDSTTLLLAIRRNNLEITKILIDSGANVLANANHFNALTIAVDNKSYEMVKVLLAAGVPVDHLTIVNDASPLLQALGCDCPSLEVVCLLLSHGADMCISNKSKFSAGKCFTPAKLLFDMSAKKRDPILAKIFKAQSEFSEALNMLFKPLHKIIIGYFGTNTYLEYEGSSDKQV